MFSVFRNISAFSYSEILYILYLLVFKPAPWLVRNSIRTDKLTLYLKNSNTLQPGVIAKKFGRHFYALKKHMR